MLNEIAARIETFFFFMLAFIVVGFAAVVEEGFAEGFLKAFPQAFHEAFMQGLNPCYCVCGGQKNVN